MHVLRALSADRPLTLAACPFVQPEFVSSCLRPQLEVVLQSIGWQLAALNRLAYRTSRLGLVCAVTKATPQGQLFDSWKHGVDAFFIGQRKLTHSRRIDEKPSGGKHQHLAVSCRVPTTAIV